MKINDGGSAFPINIVLRSDGISGAPIKSQLMPGMTIRDYFAAKAMQSIISDPRNMHPKFNLFKDPLEGIAEVSYKFADAMLLEREKSKVNVA